MGENFLGKILPREALIEVVHARVAFLVAQMPRIEVAITQLQTQIEGSKKEFKVEEMMKMYNKIYTLYNNSLDLLRKILVQYPTDNAPVEEKLLATFRNMTPENQSRLVMAAEVLEKEYGFPTSDDSGPKG